MSASNSSAAAKSAPPTDDLSARAIELAAAVEAVIQQGKAVEALSPEAVQALMACAAKIYGANIDAGNVYDAYSARNPLAPTDVMITASGLLKAANLAVFELGMWQSWTGR